MKTKSRSSRPVAIDLFCGAGGLSEGLRLAGFRTALGLDFDRHAMATYQANHEDAIGVCEDVSQLRSSDIFDAAGTKQIDVIAGGPSCQGYSTHGKRIEDDPRNFLFREFVRLVRDVKPKFFIMENVKGLLGYRQGHFRRLITESFNRTGYAVTCGTLCAADFGAPQLRHRVFFIGTRLGVPLAMPEPTHGPSDSLFGLRPHVTVAEAIDDLPRMRGRLDREAWKYAHEPRSAFQRFVRYGTVRDTVSLHQANGLSEQARRLAKYIGQGEGLRAVPVNELPDRFKRMRRISTGALRRDCTTLYHRLHPDRPSYTITCYFRNVASGPFMHPFEDRSISNREAARLQSFPDSYEFIGASIPRQIGNAVPPLLGRAVGQQVLRLMGARISTPRDLLELVAV